MNLFTRVFFQFGNAVVIDEVSSRFIKKYNGKQVIFRAKVDQDKIPANIAKDPMHATSTLVRELMDNLVEKATEGLRPHDLVRTCIRANGLDNPISVPMSDVASFTTEKILATVEKVLQSKQEIPMDEGFMADITTIRREAGGSGASKVSNIQIDRLRKKSVWCVPSDTLGLCCAKAILYAEAHLMKSPPYSDPLAKRRHESFRKSDRPALMNEALNLHEKTGVPKRPCTFEDIAVFEIELGLQIAVISAENMNKVLFSYKVFLSFIFF